MSTPASLIVYNCTDTRYHCWAVQKYGWFGHTRMARWECLRCGMWADSRAHP